MIRCSLNFFLLPIMNKSHTSLAFALLSAALIVGCSTTKGTAYDGQGYNSFVASLQSSQVPLEKLGSANPALFDGRGYILSIAGQMVQVIEYSNPQKAEAEAKEISSDGRSIRGQDIGFTKTPHFFLKGKTIVLYPGNSADIIERLTDLLGAQVAGG